MTDLLELLKIADIHRDRIKMAIDKLSTNLPFTSSKVQSLSEQEILLTELIVSRFGKLQDLLGNKIFNSYLILHDENIDKLTMLDKLHKLEKFDIIENSDLWREMRIIRNNATHEYPDNPELAATSLNQLIEYTPKLLEILEKIRSKLNTMPEVIRNPV